MKHLVLHLCTLYSCPPEEEACTQSFNPDIDVCIIYRDVEAFVRDVTIIGLMGAAPMEVCIDLLITKLLERDSYSLTCQVNIIGFLFDS